MIERVGGILRRKFVRDTLTLQIGKVGVLVLGVISSIVIPVRMGVESYGVWQLGLSLYGIWQTLNLTGLLPSAQTRLAVAVGAKDSESLLNTMGVFVRVTLIYCVLSTVGLLLVLPLLTRFFYGGDTTIPTLALILTLTQPTELLYHLLIITFSSRRQMRQVAILQNANQTVLVGTAIVAVFIAPTPTAIVTARLIYSVVTLVMVAVVYQRTLDHTALTYPSLWQVLRAAPTASGADYWRFGLTNALDKNVANLYSTLPVQIVGAVAGNAAAGYIGLALNAVRQQTFFTSAVLDNMQAVVPQAVGRGDYARLWTNFNRVLMVLAVGGLAFFGVFALAAPWVVPLLYGESWVPVVPLLQGLALFGAVTTVGSVFGPLYRAFDYVRGAFLVKLVALLVMLPVGYGLVVWLGAMGGVWMMNGLYVSTILLTAWLTLPELGRRARMQREGI